MVRAVCQPLLSSHTNYPPYQSPGFPPRKAQHPLHSKSLSCCPAPLHLQPDLLPRVCECLLTHGCGVSPERALQCLSAVVQVDFQQKEAELFAPQSILPWFAWDTKLGSLSLHLDSTQTFAAEVYAYTMGLQVPICSCMASFVHSFACSFFPLFIRSFVHSCIRSFICSFTHAVMCSFMQPFQTCLPLRVRYVLS